MQVLSKLTNYNFSRIILSCIFISLFLVPLCYSYTEIQYSLDNLTWKHATYTNNNTATLEVLNNGIKIDSTYYFRLRHHYSNGISNWTYIYSTSESTSQNNYYYFYIAGLIVFITLLILGKITENYLFPILSGFTLCIIGIGLALYSFPNLTNVFLKNSIVVVLMGIGFYLIIMPSLQMIEDGSK